MSKKKSAAKSKNKQPDPSELKVNVVSAMMKNNISDCTKNTRITFISPSEKIKLNPDKY